MPKVHLVCDYSKIKKSSTTLWVVVSSTYTVEALRKVCKLLKVETFWKYKLPSSTSEYPKLDSIKILDKYHHRLCYHLVGMTEWMF